MKNSGTKFLTFFTAGFGLAAGAIMVCGYGFIFKAIRLNLKNAPTTPSVDDAEHFSFNPVFTRDPQPWARHGSYNTQPLPAAVLDNLAQTNTSALLVASQGTLRHEQYWLGHTDSSLLNAFSIAKGILSLLVGAAIGDGKIESENQLFSDFYPQYSEMEFGKELTLKHLMTMQAGLDWQEEYHHPFAPNSKQYFVDDLAKQVFELKFSCQPGTKYEYQSAAPQLLGFALRKAVGQRLADYLSQKIWKPLHMEHDAKWSTDGNGMEKAFCCIHASARDFLKIGQMVLDGGHYGGKSIISREFINRALAATEENDAFGYAIWANNDCRIPHHFFYGYLGQFIIIVPEKQMVIVKFGHYNHLPVDGKLRPEQVNFLVEALCGHFS